MKKLNEALTTTDAAVSRAIRGVTKSDISHAMIYSLLGTKPFQESSRAKRRLDQLSG
jgi:hypothetical protein